MRRRSVLGGRLRVRPGAAMRAAPHLLPQRCQVGLQLALGHGERHLRWGARRREHDASGGAECRCHARAARGRRAVSPALPAPTRAPLTWRRRSATTSSGLNLASWNRSGLSQGGGAGGSSAPPGARAGSPAMLLNTAITAFSDAPEPTPTWYGCDPDTTHGVYVRRCSGTCSEAWHSCQKARLEPKALRPTPSSTRVHGPPRPVHGAPLPTPAAAQQPNAASR